jgi:hypothetical protein
MLTGSIVRTWSTAGIHFCYGRPEALAAALGKLVVFARASLKGRLEAHWWRKSVIEFAGGSLSFSNISTRKRPLCWICRFLQRAALCLSLILIGQPVGAVEQGLWQDQSDEPDKSKVVQLLKIYGVAPTRLSVMRFNGLREAIGDVLLFRASNDPDCVQRHSCWYVLLSSNSREVPIVTTCEFQDGSLPHHFHADSSSFFVFDFSCSGALMQIQISNGHFFVAVDPKR